MKFLVIAKQKKNVDTFEGVLGELLALGHEVTLAIQQRDPERDARLAERLRHERFSLVPCPDERTDAWRAAAPLVRTARDWAQYTRPAYRKAARARGIPVWMLLFSWDNLSTKGALHERPDLMFVWNERQRQEAEELHDVPADRVVVAGAPRFDEFFALEPRVTREAFFAPLGLDPGRPALLYLCSSRFIAARELDFIGTWLATLRAAGPPLDRCTVIVRPHPDVVLVEDGPEPEVVTWASMRQATGWVQRPFDDPAALVLRTTYGTPQACFECLHHARAVV